MAITITALKPVLQRLVNAARPGTKLPNNLNDSNAVELLSLMCDFIAPPDDPEDQVHQLNELGESLGVAVEMGAARRPRQTRQEKQDIAAAKLFMKTGARVK